MIVNVNREQDIKLIVPYPKLYALKYFKKDFKDIKGLNLGCGDRPIRTFTNLDYMKGNNVFITEQDLFKANWDIENNIFEYIYSSHFFEHIPHRAFNIPMDIFYLVMANIINCAKDKAILEIKVPFPKVEVLEIDQHCRLISERTFNHYTGVSIHSMDINDKTILGNLELLEKIKVRKIKHFPINDYHFRKYLNIELGLVEDLVLIFRVHKH